MSDSEKHSQAHGGRLDRVRVHLKKVRPVVVVCAVPVSLCLVELPFNTSFPLMSPYFLLLNLLAVGVLFAIVYLICQRTRGAVIVFMAVCLVFGLVNHFLVEFKGWPLMPSDLFALSTAAEVGEGYTLTFTLRIVISIALFAAYSVLVWLLPKVKINVRRFAASTITGLALAVGFGCFMAFVDIEHAFGCDVDVWSVKESYEERGSTLCFLKRVQDLAPSAPEGYSEDAAKRLIADAAESEGDADAHDDPLKAASFDGQQDPTVIVVMNETFADLSIYPGLEGSDAYPSSFYDIAADSVESGTVYVSAYGGGTCNSEFEFLTGSSMGILGAGVYPYMMYNLGGVDSLVSYFSDLGYATHAIHPAEPTNWRRDAVYEQLGFDDFASIDSFEDADTLRDLVTDRATYDCLLGMLAEDPDPQFIFDVTIQNHGGYDTGGIDEEDRKSVTLPDGSTDDEIDEYVSCIQRSDADLAYLVGQLESLDRPIYLCFFGDHQPNFSEWLYEETEGESVVDAGIEAAQMNYSTPYLIWGNEAAREDGVGRAQDADSDGGRTDADGYVNTEGDSDDGDDRTDVSTSLGYLGARLVSDTGLAPSGRQRFLLKTSEIIPVVNLNGCLLPDGSWRGYSDDEKDDPDVDDALNDYAIVQYDNLFG